MTNNIILSSSQRSILLSNQQGQKIINKVQEALATGKDVNRAIDDPQNFFGSNALSNRAKDLDRRIDGIGQAIQALQETNTGTSSIIELLDLANSTIDEFLIDPDLEYPNILPDNNSDFQSYGAVGQDIGGIFELQNEGNDFLLDGNLWKYFDFDYTVTENTILEFEYRSTIEPEVASIAFDNDVFWDNTPRHFKVYGDQGLTAPPLAASEADFQYSGSGDFEEFQIRVGDFYTGTFDRIAFVNDDDGGGIDGNSTWRNVKVYDEGSPRNLIQNAKRQQFQDSYATILSQINQLASDTNYRGINLLTENNLEILFNETGTNTLISEGINATSSGLGLLETNFLSEEKLLLAQAKIRTARKDLRQFTSSIQSDLNILKTRLSFTENTINTLKSGADDLVISDQNQKATELLAMQVRQSLSTTALSLASESFNNVLRLF